MRKTSTHLVGTKGWLHHAVVFSQSRTGRTVAFGKGRRRARSPAVLALYHTLVLNMDPTWTFDSSDAHQKFQKKNKLPTAQLIYIKNMKTRLHRQRPGRHQLQHLHCRPPYAWCATESHHHHSLMCHITAFGHTHPHFSGKPSAPASPPLPARCLSYHGVRRHHCIGTHFINSSH